MRASSLYSQARRPDPFHQAVDANGSAHALNDRAVTKFGRAELDLHFDAVAADLRLLAHSLI
jgi:hypothetical protein